MEPPQAKVFARAFELGMLRVLSVVATKQEALLSKQELRSEIATLRNEMRFYMLINFGMLGAVLGVIISKL